MVNRLSTSSLMLNVGHRMISCTQHGSYFPSIKSINQFNFNLLFVRLLQQQQHSLPSLNKKSKAFCLAYFGCLSIASNNSVYQQRPFISTNTCGLNNILVPLLNFYSYSRAVIDLSAAWSTHFKPIYYVVGLLAILIFS